MNIPEIRNKWYVNLNYFSIHVFAINVFENRNSDSFLRQAAILMRTVAHVRGRTLSIIINNKCNHV